MSRTKRTQTGRHRITVDVGEALETSLGRAAKKLDAKPSELVRLAVTEFLEPARSNLAEHALLTFEARTRQLLVAFRACRESMPDGEPKAQFQDAIDDLLEAIARVMDLRK